MSRENPFVSERDKEVAIQNIMGKFKRRYFKLMFILIVIFVVLINIFPFKPKFNNIDSPISNLYQYERIQSEVFNYAERYTPEDGGYTISLRGKKYQYKVSKTKDSGSIISITDRYSVGERDLIKDSITYKSSFIGKFDKDLNKVWSIGGIQGISIDNYLMYIYDAVEINDDSIVGVGKAIHNDDASLDDIALFFITSTGDQITYQLFNELDIENYTNLLQGHYQHLFHFNIVKTENGGFTVSITNSVDEYLMISFNDDRKINWQKIFHEGYSYDIYYDYSGNYYLLSKKSYYYSPSGYHVIKLSHEGDILWEKNYDFQITTLHITKDNNVILGGHQHRDYIKFKKSSYLFGLENACDKKYDEVCGYGGMNYSVMAQINPQNGKVNWVDEFAPNKSDYYLSSIVEDKDGTLYAHVINHGHYHFIVKYNKDGNRLGESPIYYDGDLYRMNMHFELHDKRIRLINLTERFYIDVNLDLKQFEKQPVMPYQIIKVYNVFIYIRVWVNRIFLLGLILLPFAYNKYDEYETKQIYKAILKREEEKKVHSYYDR